MLSVAFLHSSFLSSFNVGIIILLLLLLFFFFFLGTFLTLWIAH
jgi:hypothetical protein